MPSFKQSLKSTLVEPITHLLQKVTTTGMVTAADEKNNVCSVRYTDKNGEYRNRDSVSVRLYGLGTDWFPEVGESVLIEDDGNTPVIIARNVQNYNMDIRSRMQLSKDIFSDSSGADPGGTIF